MNTGIENTLADAFSVAVQWIDRGFELEKVPDDVQRLRYTICQSCPAGMFEPTEKRCGKCKCPNMDFKTSLKYNPIPKGFIGKKTEISCPLGYW